VHDVLMDNSSPQMLFCVKLLGYLSQTEQRNSTDIFIIMLFARFHL